ncbi:MAG TPA: hypothetical protein VGM69_21795 [Chloroflexota bacterium]
MLLGHGYLGSFVKVFTLRPFRRFMLNSLTVASPTTVLAIAVGRRDQGLTSGSVTSEGPLH